MYIAKYSGLDLPEFTPEKELMATKEAMEIAASGDEPTMLRFCKTLGAKDDPLVERLRRTKSYLERLSDHTGIRLIDFHYGLYPEDHCTEINFTDSDRREQDIVPEGFVLAAEVQIIKSDDSSTIPKQLKHSDPHNISMRDFVDTIREEKGRLLDIIYWQTIYGSPVGLAESNPDYYYVDVEPIMSAD